MSSGPGEPADWRDADDQPSVRWTPPASIARSDVAAEVFETLVRLNTDIASWYRGALETLAAAPHADRFAQAAHGLREVMKDVHVLAGAPLPPAGGLGQRFQTLVTAWRRGQDQSRCHDGANWSGEIDDHARNAFSVVEETIEWSETFMPTRREAFIRATRQLDPSGRTLPESEEQRLWRAWSDTKEYFDAVAHHGKKTSDGEFRSELERLESFVLRLFRRDVYAEQQRIAALVARAERGA
jgi:hypothetical protein